MSRRSYLTSAIRSSAQTVTHTLRMLWRAAPFETFALTVLLLIQSIAPAVNLYLIKGILDTL
jgi:hypothetical protein